MRKKINILRYISVLILTIMIFTIGIFIGTSVEEARIKNLYNQLSDQNLDYQNLITENNYIDYLLSENNFNKTNSCKIIKGSYYASIVSLDNSRLKLENYINQGKVKLEEFSRLKSFYTNLQINYWITANKINMVCDSNLNSILYFYGDKKKCPSCEDQGIHLNYVKQKLNDNVLIFSIDVNKKGVVDLLKQKYQINERELPIIIINNKIYNFKTNDEIFKILNISN